MKKELKNITLLGLDCIDIERLKLAADICQKDFEFAEVKLLSSIPNTDPRVVHIDPVNSREEYSRFFIKNLNDFVDTEFVLIIQYDGFILNPNAWTDEFLQYDYIGAPWWYMDGMNVGNGGFSLRSKKLLSILQTADFITEYDPEDHHICRTYHQQLNNLGIRYAPQSLAERFAIEGLQKEHKVDANNAWNGQFGFHGLEKTDISKWLNAHPEYAHISNILDPRYLR